ncbi:unnamed protein product [Nesidiocoris tenuis]|uniref:JmjN domain-containing protein n=1 Tax=Nesidiocoris tenuis TaxID=355587 RepID=A0A6H5GF81_9HEMI|nr:unnamed protein product [Nesidiocoris tenuis]
MFIIAYISGFSRFQARNVQRASRSSICRPASSGERRWNQNRQETSFRCQNGREKASVGLDFDPAVRPSRKTKTAASLYMEMITKDLRSPDEDDESPEKSTESDGGSSTPQNTRQRRSLGTSEIDSTPPSSKSSIKKSTRASKGSAASPSPSTSGAARRKAIAALPSGKKVKVKKEDEANDSQGDEATTSRTSRKSSPPLRKPGRKPLKSESPEAPKPGAAKSAMPKKGAGTKKPSPADDVEEDEASSQSEDEEDSGSRSNVKRSKAPQKGVSSLAKKASLKSAKEMKSVGKNVEKDVSPKRSTRSAGTAGDSLPDAQPKTNEKKATPGATSRKPSKLASKDSESGNHPSDKLAKSASIKPAVDKKAAARDSDDSESEDEEAAGPSSRSQSVRSSKGAKPAESVEESTKKSTTRVGKRNANKAAQLQSERRSTRRRANSSDESDSDTHKLPEKRVTRKSNQFVKTKDTADDSEDSDGELSPKPKRTRRPIKAEKDDHDSSDSEKDSKSRKPLKSNLPNTRRASSKTQISDESEDEEMKSEDTPKTRRNEKKQEENKSAKSKTKKAMRDESADESEDEVPAKRLKANIVKKSESASNSSDSKQKVAGKKTSIGPSKSKEEPLKKAVPPKALEKAEAEAEISSKRTTRVSTPTILPVEVSNPDAKETASKKPTGATKKAGKDQIVPPKESVDDSEGPEKGKIVKLTKDGKVPAKRGRKPKSLVNQIEAAKTSVETRPTRTRRSAAAVKKESYSELSDVESEESDVALPRTRGRRSNVRYTEKDSEDEESEEEMQEETEKRPRRSTRAVFCSTLGLDIESDFDDLDDFTTIPIQKPKPVPTEAKAAENEGKPNKTVNKPTGTKITDGAVKKSDSNSMKGVADKRMKLDDGNASDSSMKRTKGLKTNRKDFSADQPDIVKILEKKIASPSVDTKPNSSAVSVPTESCKDPIESPKICVALNGDNIESTKKPDSLPTTDSVLSREPEVKREPPRVSRRSSRDLADKAVELDLVLRVEDDADDQSPPAKLASSRLGLVGKSVDQIDRATDQSKTVGENFDLTVPNKEHYEDGLATLADVAFSELQSRKNIMERKLSSDSATSFSSEDVLLPVRRDKIVPKAKADLPTVREKTESDEEISDVGNEDTDDGSSYDEFRKASKQFRRKRLPRRSRKDSSRPQSRRPVRSVRLAADSYVDGDLSSSDRSSTPDLVQVKPTPKKVKKPDDKTPAKHSTAPRLQSGSVTASNSQPPPSAVSPQGSLVAELKKAKDVPQLPAKIARDQPKPTPSPRDDIPKTAEPPRPLALHKSTPQQPQVKISPPHQAPQAELIPTKSHVSLTSPKDGASVDVRNNNSMTLFSGVSGVRVMKPAMSDNRALLGKPGPAKTDAPRPYQAAHPKLANETPGKASQSIQPPFPAHQNLQPKDPYRAFPDAAANLSALDLKSKPNIGDTWKNAFINAKLPKPGQLSPAHHSSGSTPFIRKQFPNSSKSAKPEDSRPNPYPPTAKLPGVQTFKTSAFPQFSKIGGQSPGRMPGSMSPSRQSPSGPTAEPKGNVYLSPARVKGSPAKAEDKVEIKKVDLSPQKSLTLLQYEKRSQELISSLKDPQPVLLDGSKTYVQAYPTKLKEYSMEKARSQVKAAPLPVPSPSTEETSKTEGGKHLNLPFAVEQAFRKRSPITVKKPAKPAVEKKAGPSVTIPETPAAVNMETSNAPRNQHASPTVSTSVTRVTTNLDILSKKKVNMTDEEIKKWLEDDSPKVHSKDCGLFENNQCKCSYRTSSESMQNTSILVTEVIKKEEPKVDHGVVEPPVQLRELDSGSKFTAETISTCKVEDYKEKMFSKTPTAPTPEVKKELVPPANVPKPKRPSASPADKAKRKSSMTEDEMCEFDFRFERTSNSPRESGSDMSSPTPRDDVSSSNDEKLDGAGHSASERKSIFMQRRPATSGLPATPKRSHLSKSPCAFSAENESSVYAFDDAPPPTVSNPFRRRGSRNRSSEEDGPIASSSIAVQVNIESPAASAPTTENSEQVLETSTQTDQNEGQLFYFPLGGDKNPQEVIQGVQVNLQNLQSTEGPEQSVIMKAKLVTKPSAAVSPPSLPSTVRPLSDAGRTTQRPEQKVRPLGSNLEHSPAKPPVVSVQPTVRDPQPSSSVTFNSQGTTTTIDRPALATRSTQAAGSPPSPAPAPSAPAQSTSTQESPPPAEAPAAVVEPAPAKPPAKSSSTGARRSSPNEFPNPGTTPRMVDAPTFYPTEKEFQDPLEYFDQIMRQAQSFAERSKLLEEVDAEWTERERRIALEAERESRGEKEEKEENSESEEESDDGRDECITKGRTMPLSGFYRIARNTMAMWFKEPSPSAKEVENEYWKQVTSRKQHVCVNSGSIDSGSFGYGFPTSKSSSTARHPWNLKVLTNNSGSILRSLGPLMGMRFPTYGTRNCTAPCERYCLATVRTSRSGWPPTRPWSLRIFSSSRASPSAGLSRSQDSSSSSSPKRSHPPSAQDTSYPRASTSHSRPGSTQHRKSSRYSSFSRSPTLPHPRPINSFPRLFFQDIKESCEQPAFSLERLIFSIATDQRSSAEVLTQVSIRTLP